MAFFIRFLSMLRFFEPFSGLREKKTGVSQIQVPFSGLRTMLPVGATATLTRKISILLGTCDKTGF